VLPGGGEKLKAFPREGKLIWGGRGEECGIKRNGLWGGAGVEKGKWPRSQIRREGSENIDRVEMEKLLPNTRGVLRKGKAVW